MHGKTNGRSTCRSKEKENPTYERRHARTAYHETLLATASMPPSLRPASKISTRSREDVFPRGSYGWCRQEQAVHRDPSRRRPVPDSAWTSEHKRVYRWRARHFATATGGERRQAVCCPAHARERGGARRRRSTSKGEIYTPPSQRQPPKTSAARPTAPDASTNAPLPSSCTRIGVRVHAMASARRWR